VTDVTKGVVPEMEVVQNLPYYSTRSLHHQARPTNRPYIHVQANSVNSNDQYSSSVDSDEMMRNRMIEITVRGLEKQVESLTSTRIAYHDKLRISSVYGSLGATDVHDMPWTASPLMGEEEKNEFGVVPTSRPQVVDRSAGTGVVVREPLEASSASAGVGEGKDKPEKENKLQEAKESKLRSS